MIRLHRLAFLTTLVAVAPVKVTGQSTTTGGFAPGARTILALDFAGTPVGDFPKGLRLLQGNLEVADKNGMHMLRASSISEFVIKLPEVLPKNFTLEFELIPKACCNPVDLMVEGVVSGSRSSVSAQIEWDAEHFAVVGGNPVMFQMDMPDSIAAAVRSQMTRVALSFEDETIRMYTNGQRLYTLTGRKFVRDTLLRVSLGGQDQDKYAVFLSRIRVADAATTAVAAPVNAIPATTTGTATPISTPISTPLAQMTGVTTPTSSGVSTSRSAPPPGSVATPPTDQCDSFPNLKATATSATSTAVIWSPMSSRCKQAYLASGFPVSDVYIVRWSSADGPGVCPSTFDELQNGVKEIPQTLQNIPLATTTDVMFGRSFGYQGDPRCPMMYTWAFDRLDDFQVQAGGTYTYRLWRSLRTPCQTLWCPESAMTTAPQVSVTTPMWSPTAARLPVTQVQLGLKYALHDTTCATTSGCAIDATVSWNAAAGAVSYLLAVDYLWPFQEGAFAFPITPPQAVPASAAPSVPLLLPRLLIVRACLGVVGDPKALPDPRKGECIVFLSEP